MEAKSSWVNTVLSEEKLRTIWREGSRHGELAGLFDVADAQAEISFKAGIKEVVEDFVLCELPDAPASDIRKEYESTSRKWQVRLKEWGVK